MSDKVKEVKLIKAAKSNKVKIELLINVKYGTDIYKVGDTLEVTKEEVNDLIERKIATDK